MIGGVELLYRLVTDTEAPAMLLVEVPAAGALIAGDLLHDRVHAVVSRLIDNWVAALDGLGGTPLILGGHGEPAAAGRLPEAVRYLRAAQASMQGAPNERERILVIAAEMERGFPDWRVRPLLELGLLRALPG